MADESAEQPAEKSPTSDDVLSTYEELFKHRYTDDDVDYVKTLKAPSAPPPCVENWYSRPKRSFDWTQRQDNRNRDHHHGRHGNEGHGNRDQRDYHHRDRYQSNDRHGGGGERDGEQRNKYYRGSHGRGHRY